MAHNDHCAHERHRAFGRSLVIVFLAVQGGVVVNPGTAMGIASAKTSLTFMQAVTRGILCNWLVCMAGEFDPGFTPNLCILSPPHGALRYGRFSTSVRNSRCRLQRVRKAVCTSLSSYPPVSAEHNFDT